MKKYVFLLALVVVGLALAVWSPLSKTIAEIDLPFIEREPDIPAMLQNAKNATTKEEFLTNRAEAFALKRGIIDGKFPDYTRVIPTNYQKHIAVNRVLLLQALQRAAILSNEKFRGVRWMLMENGLRISCTNNEQEEAQEELEVDYQGDALDVGFNITYLLDVLNNVDAERIDCAFGDANSSMLVTLPERADYRYVVMPMRI